jgi:hypothetical protein
VIRQLCERLSTKANAWSGASNPSAWPHAGVPAAAGHKLSTVENLAVTQARGACVASRLRPSRGAPQNQFDSIDLSDNELVKLEGFPPLKRLSTLLVHNNRIARISASLAGAPACLSAPPPAPLMPPFKSRFRSWSR